MSILLVEDDELLGDGIATGLQQEDYVVTWIKDGLIAQSLLQTEQFDAIILDLGLPSKSGFEILHYMRQNKINFPVLILTAKDTVEDRVKGLDAGADDYMVKPFNLDELNARLRAIIRRSVGRATPVIKHGDIILDPASHQVTYQGLPVGLSRREYAVLHVLLKNPGKVMPRNQLIDQLYGWDEEIDSNTLEVHIHHIRKKFNNRLIRTIRGVGYMILNEQD